MNADLWLATLLTIYLVVEHKWVVVNKMADVSSHLLIVFQSL